MAATYTITHDKGTTFKLYAVYKSSTGGAIDLTGQTASMQVRKSPDDSSIVLFATNTSVTGGGSTGEFASGSGIAGVGGITLNSNSTGSTTGTTGGIFVRVDATTSANLPTGRLFYDLELNDSGEITRLIEGRFETKANITR